MEWDKEYMEKFEDLEREYRHGVEDYIANFTMPLINELGDQAKAINATKTVNWIFNDTPAISLADYVEPQPQESNSMAYAGAAFGVIAVVAAGAIYKNFRNKKNNSNEESLL